LIFPDDLGFYGVGDGNRCLCWVGEEFRGNFFNERESWELSKVVVSFFDRNILLDFDHISLSACLTIIMASI